QTSGRLAFSSDSKTLAFAGNNGGGYLWDVATTQRRALLWLGGRGSASVLGVAFTLDDSKLIVGCASAKMGFQIWHLDKLPLEKVDPAKVVLDGKGPGINPGKNPGKDPGKEIAKKPPAPPPPGAVEAVRLAGRIEAYLGAVFNADGSALLLALPR